MIRTSLAVLVLVLFLGSFSLYASPLIIVTHPHPPLIIVGNVPEGFVTEPSETYAV